MPVPSASNSLDPDQVQCVLGPVCEERQANQGVVISIPTRPDPYFREDLSSNIFYGLSSPASDFRRAAVSYKRKYV